MVNYRYITNEQIVSFNKLKSRGIMLNSWKEHRSLYYRGLFVEMHEKYGICWYRINKSGKIKQY